MRPSKNRDGESNTEEVRNDETGERIHGRTSDCWTQATLNRCFDGDFGEVPIDRCVVLVDGRFDALPLLGGDTELEFGQTEP